MLKPPTALQPRLQRATPSGSSALARLSSVHACRQACGQACLMACLPGRCAVCKQENVAKGESSLDGLSKLCSLLCPHLPGSRQLRHPSCLPAGVLLRR